MWSLRLIASPVPAAPFSGGTTSAPSQADGDCPEPQEVSVSKEACLQFVSLGLLLPPSGPSSSGCLSLEGNGLQPANSVPSFVLCADLAVSYVRAFHVIAIPLSALLVQVSLLCSGQSLKSNAARASLPSPCLLVAGADVCAASLMGELPLGL